MKVECTHCHKRFNAPDEYKGRTTKCPACGGSFVLMHILEGENSASKGGNPIEDIQKLVQLKEKGLLTEQEFKVAKTRLFFTENGNVKKTMKPGNSTVKTSGTPVFSYQGDSELIQLFDDKAIIIQKGQTTSKKVLPFSEIENTFFVRSRNDKKGYLLFMMKNVEKRVPSVELAMKLAEVGYAVCFFQENMDSYETLLNIKDYIDQKIGRDKKIIPAITNNTHSSNKSISKNKVLQWGGILFFALFLLVMGFVYIDFYGHRYVNKNKIPYPPLSSYDNSEVNHSTDSDPSYSPARIVTYDEYLRVQPGQSYSEVISIIGTTGEEIVRNKIEGVPGVMNSINTIMYQWINEDGSNMNAMFQNGKLIQKAQFGLD